MTDQPQTKAITPYSRLKDLLANPEVKARFVEVLGKKAGAFLSSVLNAVYLNNSLKDCDPNSIMVSALRAAALDMPVDPNLGFAAIVPYKGQGQLQIMYKGMVQLAMRSGAYRAMNDTPIYQGQTVVKDQLTGRIKIKGDPLSKQVIGWAFYYQLNNGFERFTYMTVEEMEEHGKRYSKSYDLPTSLWKTNKPAMYRKTVIKKGLSFAPMSISWREMVALDEDEAEHEAERAEESIIDGTFSEAPSFDPVAVLVGEHISENDYAAAGLLAKAPDEIKGNRDALVQWGKVYRAWRDLGKKSDEAAQLATDGVIPQ